MGISRGGEEKFPGEFSGLIPAGIRLVFSID
jgi:hypothetical protein